MPDTVAPSPQTSSRPPASKSDGAEFRPDGAAFRPDGAANLSEDGAAFRPDGAANLSEEGAATFTQANDSLQRIGGAYMAISSDNMAALTEAGAQAGRLMTDMTKSYIDALNYVAVTYAGLGRDCLTCRTPADVVEFQKKAMEGFTETYEAVSKVYSNLFESFSTAFEPLMARSADGPERMFRAFAD